MFPFLRSLCFSRSNGGNSFPWDYNLIKLPCLSLLCKHIDSLFSLCDIWGGYKEEPQCPDQPLYRWLRTTPSLNPFITVALVGVTSEACQLDIGNVDSTLGNWARLPEFIPEL